MKQPKGNALGAPITTAANNSRSVIMDDELDRFATRDAGGPT